MKERLQKLIASAGLCSRRRAEEWISQGKVTVNGGLARLGDTADPAADEILVEGKPLPAAPEERTTVLLYKPRGYVTTLSDERGRPTVAQLLPPELGRLYPVGRLDQFSEGLLLMTNDGALAKALTHPSGEVSKTYRLWVSGWHEKALALLRRPIVLDGYRIKAPEVRLLWVHACHSERSEESVPPTARGERRTGPSMPLRSEASPFGRSGQDDRSETMVHGATACLEITIHEGRNRQIRRMAQAAGLTPTRLKRMAEGSLTLGDLKPGQWRKLTKAELSLIEN